LIKHSPPYSHWDFPKGHIEKGERTEEAVRREVKEETGISRIQIIPGFKETKRYFVNYTGEKALKFVAYFLAKTNEKKIKISDEHEDFVWLPFGEACDRITYRTSKEVFKKAHEFISRKGV
jgi:8-oxo-dGTP pyrophosphatase MutT (NUDIX family)